MRSGLFFPLFDDLADPALVARLAAEAEQAGWHGVFVWDHVRWREPIIDVADPWITLADPTPYAAAGATWWLVEVPWDPVSVDQVRGVIRDGPATPRVPARTGSTSTKAGA